MQGETDLQPLIDQTRERRQQLASETERGRDRLLERHSHNPEIGSQIIRSLEERESAVALYDFTEQLFDRIGIDQEYLEEKFEDDPADMVLEEDGWEVEDSDFVFQGTLVVEDADGNIIGEGE